jgi:hypothetical protein
MYIYSFNNKKNNFSFLVAYLSVIYEQVMSFVYYYMFAIMLCTLPQIIAHSVKLQRFYYDTDICTGLGDRVGTILTLAALARHENSEIVFWWCDKPPTGIYDRIRPWIPEWAGYNYSLDEFKIRFEPPSQVKLTQIITPKHQKLARVLWTSENRNVQGCDSVYTLAWKMLYLNNNRRVPKESFRLAYQAVARPMAERARIRHRSGGDFVALHMRGPDKNSPNTYNDYENDMFCTGRVIKKLLKMGVNVLAISNNATWANGLLDGRLPIVFSNPAYDDFDFLLAASAIVQHVWGGWSSYSHVPALASGSPIINTYIGSNHRMDYFKGHGSLPVEMYNCDQTKTFVTETLKILTRNKLIKQQVVGSLTTIPSRIAVDCRKAIDSILPQVSHIYLAVSENHSRFGPLGQLPDYLTEEPYVSKVTVTKCPDYGAASKYIGSLSKIPIDDTWVFIFDDDQVYRSDLIERMMKNVSEIGAYQNRFHEIKEWCDSGKPNDGGLIRGYTGNLIHISLLREIMSFPIPLASFFVDDQWISILYHKLKIPIFPTGVETYDEVFATGYPLQGSNSLSKIGNRSEKVRELELEMGAFFDNYNVISIDV